jgi:hypothetical protein
MFPQMIDPLVERFRPHVLTARDEVRVFAGCVIDRLDTIADALHADDVYSLRRPVIGNSAAGPASAVIEVPSNDEWILESVIARTAPAAAATLDIRDQASTGTGALRFAADIPATGGYTSNFAPLRFMGGSVMTAVMSQPGEFRLIFRYDRPRPRRQNVGTGWRSDTPDRDDERTEVADTRRHVGSWHPGVPIFGPSAPSNGR